MSARESKLASGWERGAASQLGGRKEQQDRWSIFSSPRPEGVLAIIADGMGGHLDGALGAQTVVDIARVLSRNHRNRSMPTRPPPSAACASACTTPSTPNRKRRAAPW
ncbi:MAG: protein phosphatase 2C family protein [Candidatus Competibacteraceae bacterium]|nr:protein phosphatase 2C family protein [Candidatus Competibacteraceae bacterium]